MDRFFYHTGLFAIYSFTGWVVEVLYRSAVQKKMINAGFLHGPLVPVYGIGGLAVFFLDSALNQFSLWQKLALCFFTLSLLEYMAGLIFELLFRLRLWDYRDEQFNIHGRVCLKFSLYWTLFSWIFITFYNPAVTGFLETEFIKSNLPLFSLFFWCFFAIDFAFSAAAAASFRTKIACFNREYLNLESIEIDRIMNSIKRLYRAFPALGRYIKRNIDINVRNRVSSILSAVQKKVITGLRGERPFDREYLDTVNDILQNREFLKLRNYFHHNSSIYEHVLRVSYFSFNLCKKLGLDYVSAARGALLHDFFLYDWRSSDFSSPEKKRLHGFRHPKTALANAQKQFEVNEVEKDIILRHMWPLTIIPPRFRESFVVTFVDKYISSQEFIDALKKRGSRKKGEEQ